MAFLNFFQDASVTGTGATELVTSDTDSTSLVDEGDTLAFSGSLSRLEVDDQALLQDGNNQPLLSSGTINGVAVNPNSIVEYNYNFVAEDPVTGYYHRIDVFSFNGDDGNKAYIVTRAWDPDTGAYVEPREPYAGQELTILSDGTVDSRGRVVSENDPDLETFLLDDVLQLNPYNNDPSGGTTAQIYMCFCEGTLIETPTGHIPVEHLAAGDLVETLDGGAQPIRWTGQSAVSLTQADAAVTPVRIPARSLGRGSPSRDLYVSPQHRILVDSRVAGRMFHARQVLVAAKHLVGHRGITRASNLRTFRYFHILLDAHQVLWANGALAESLLPGPEAQRIMSGADPSVDLGVPADAARPLIRGRVARQLNRRLTRNGHPAVESVGV